MKFLSKRIKVTLFVAVTVLFALTLLLMNSSKVYCATDTLQSVANLGNKGFFSYGLQLNEPETAERIYDSDNSYKQESLAVAEWKYPNEDQNKDMATRNLESFYLYGRDATNKELKLKPVNDKAYWTNYNAENYLYVRFKQVNNFPNNVIRNNDAMTMNSYKLNSYYKTSGNSTKINTGIILHRKATNDSDLWSATWESQTLKDDACIYVEAPAYVEIAILYELREIKGNSSYYSHCVARYCVWVAKR